MPCWTVEPLVCYCYIREIFEIARDIYWSAKLRWRTLTMKLWKWVVFQFYDGFRLLAGYMRRIHRQLCTDLSGLLIIAEKSMYYDKFKLSNSQAILAMEAITLYTLCFPVKVRAFWYIFEITRCEGAAVTSETSTNIMQAEPFIAERMKEWLTGEKTLLKLQQKGVCKV